MNKKMDEPRPQNPNEVGAAPEAGEGSSQAETRKSQEAAKRKNSQREVHSAEIRAKKELTKHAKDLGLDPNLREKAIRDQLRSQQVEIEGKKVSLDEGLVKLAKAIAKDETSPEHALFEGLDLSVKNLQDNPSIAWVILKTASLDGVSTKPKLLLQLSLEAAHRGGDSELAQKFRSRLRNRLVELYERNPQAVEKEYLDKVGEIADRVEQFPEKSIEWYGREEDGELSRQDLKDFRNKPEEGEEFTDKLAKLTKPEPVRTESQEEPEREGGVIDEEEEPEEKSYLENTLTQKEFDKLSLQLQRLIKQYDNILRSDPDLIDLRNIRSMREAIAGADTPEDAEIIKVRLLDYMREKEKLEREKEEGFTTFLAQYLTEKEKKTIRSGPEGWEEVFDEIMLLLTADPMSDVLREQALMSKMAAMFDYIRTVGPKHFMEKHGYTQEKADDAVEKWIRELSTEQADQARQHDSFRGIILSSNAEESSERIYKNITERWFENLSGNGIDKDKYSDKRRIVIDINRRYDGAIMEYAAKKMRRWDFLDRKVQQRNPLTPSEQLEYDQGAYLTYDDLIPQPKISRAAQAKKARLNVWTTVQERAAALNLDINEETLKRIIHQLTEENTGSWRVIDEEMEKRGIELENRDWLISELIAEGRINAAPLPKDIDNLYYQVERELIDRDMTPGDLLYEYTRTELKHLGSEEMLSPVEQIVYDELIATEEVYLREEAEYKETRGDFENDGKKEEWLKNQTKKRERYIIDGIRRARQHYYFARRAQKINVTMGNIPTSLRGLPGLPLEYEQRPMHHLLVMQKRFDFYGQPITRELSSLTRIFFLNSKNAEKMRLSHTREWEDELEKARTFKEKKKHKYREIERYNAAKGVDSLIDYLGYETNLRYNMMIENPMIDHRGNYDVSMWRGEHIGKDPIEEILFRESRLGSIDDLERVEYWLGMQFAVASEINESEVKRAADNFRSLQILLERTRASSTDNLLQAASSSIKEVKAAQSYLLGKVTDEEGRNREAGLRAVDKMLELIDSGDTKAVQDFYDGKYEGIEFKLENGQTVELSEYFKKNIVRELETERRKYILKQISIRIPTYVAYYFADDVANNFDEILADRDRIREELELATDLPLEDLVSSEAFFNKREELWGGLEKALYAVQNEIVRLKIPNGQINAHFEERLDMYLREFIGEENFSRYGEQLKEMTSYLREYFNRMENGERVGKVARIKREKEELERELTRGGLSEEQEEKKKARLIKLTINDNEAKILGRKQLDIIARTPIDMTLELGTMPIEDMEYSNWGSQAAQQRLSGEFIHGMHAMDSLGTVLTTMHTAKLEDTIAELAKFTHGAAGWMGPEKAVIPTKSAMRAMGEMLKAPQTLERFPILEPVMRYMMDMGHDSKLREIAYNTVSRIAQAGGNPDAPIMQKHELKDLVEIAQQVDLYIQQPEVLEESRGDLGVTRSELRRYGIKKAGTYIVFAMFIMYIAYSFQQVSDMLGQPA